MKAKGFLMAVLHIFFFSSSVRADHNFPPGTGATLILGTLLLGLPVFTVGVGISLAEYYQKEGRKAARRVTIVISTLLTAVVAAAIVYRSL